MDNEKMPEALRLADELEMWTQGEPAAAELRRLHAECESLRAALQIAIRQNEHDMLMTGDELRAARAALKEAK